MSDHTFNPFIAKEYGINEAILINNFIFWTRTNAAANKNFHDGRYWSYGTPEFFAKYFPYFKPRLIKDILSSCIKKGLLIKGNYNKNYYDKTNWYSLSDKILSELNYDITCLQTAKTEIGRNPSNQQDEIRPINKTKSVQPIPDNETVNKTYLKKKIKKKKIESLTVYEMSKDNPNLIPLELIEEWEGYRRKPITSRVWVKTNQVLHELVSKHNLNAVDAFEIMLEKQWQGIEVYYFDNILTKKDSHYRNGVRRLKLSDVMGA